MKIELSPWFVSETTVQLPRKRRRTRSRDEDALTSRTCDLQVLASFVEGGAYERGSVTGKWESVICLTSQNEIRVLGRTLVDGGHVLHESKRLTQVSRPSSTFFECDNDSTPPWIPCLYQADRFYALQNGNTRLVSWTSDQTVEEGYNARLNSPALSLTRDGRVVVGACQDGSFFVARPSPGIGLDIEISCTGVPASAVHVATCFDPSPTWNAATRPKACPIIQIYADTERLLLYRHVLLSSGGCSSKVVQCEFERAASRLHFVGQHEDEVVLRYSLERQHYCCAVSLSEARITKRVALPAHLIDLPRNHVGLLGPVIVLAPPRTPYGGRGCNVWVVDVNRGGATSEVSVDVQYDQLLSLHTDGNRRLALIIVRDDSVCVALTSIRRGVQEGERGSNAALSQRLADRSVSSPRDVHGAGTTLLYDECSTIANQSVHLLNDTLRDLQRATSNSKKIFFTGAYIETILSLSGGSRTSTHGAMDIESANNPQEPYEHEVPLNGNKRASHLQTLAHDGMMGANGVRFLPSQKLALEPRMLPEVFLRPASQITVEVLLLPHLALETRNEARGLLRSFVRSGKLSGRQVLANPTGLLHGLERRPKREDRIAYSPVDFIFDFFRCCRDVSELQAVAAMTYLIGRASPEDISSYLRRDEFRRHVDSPQGAVLDDVGDSDDARVRNEQIAQESTKMRLMVACSFVRVLALYSTCNEILLKNAVCSLLSKSDVALLCRLFSAMLNSKMVDCSGSKLLVLRWLAVVHVLRSRQLLRQETETLDDATHVQKAIRLHARAAESLIALKQLVGSSVGAAKTVLSGAIRSPSHKKEHDATQSYQIERLVI